MISLSSLLNTGNTETISDLWDRTFLNYTPEKPDSWLDPEGLIQDDLQLPQNAVPLLSFLLDQPHGPELHRDRIQAYCEFFAAVWQTKFSAGEWKTALPFLKRCAELWQNQKLFTRLADAVEKAIFAEGSLSVKTETPLFNGK